ncbi:hypothetical protein PM082_014160 [Marasmius tenuissimus]|nr:hypothetical protein PM082_014160 [Marasmius tenuissimus]
MRQVVSYEDITLPYVVTANAVQEVSKLNFNHKSHSKKRKRKARNSNNRDNDHHQEVFAEGQYEEQEEDDMELSRELTHEEIWDDSALIEAWNAATEEYEAYHGPDKGWKAEPVHKSALWYNVPPAKKVKLSEDQPSRNVKAGPSALTGTEGEGDSKPIDFDTFVPEHDPALAKPPQLEAAGHPVSYSLPEGPQQMVSRDEAFSRALNATYWSGYWTAVYHCHNSMGKPSGAAENSQGEEGGHEEEDEEGVVDEGEDCEGEEEPHDVDIPDTMHSAPALGPQNPRNLPRVEDFVSTQR